MPKIFCLRSEQKQVPQGKEALHLLHFAIFSQTSFFPFVVICALHANE